jgi:hypothetical protein
MGSHVTMSGFGAERTVFDKPVYQAQLGALCI